MIYDIQVNFENKGSFTFRREFEDRIELVKFLIDVFTTKRGKFVFLEGEEFMVINMEMVVAIFTKPAE